MKTVRLILGDQLNARHSWFNEKNPNVLYALMEVRSETDYAPHHIQKVCAIFTAMRRFAQALESAGHQVRYIQLDEKTNKGFKANLKRLIQEHEAQRFEYQLPDEYRVEELLKKIADELTIETGVSDTEHFLTDRNDLQNFFKGKKTYLMESFYRQMRKKYGLLMTGDEPEGGKWNFDASNRKKLPKDIDIPEPLEFDTDVSEIIQMLEREEVKTIGTVNTKKLGWPTSRREAQQVLEYFAEHLLYRFGTYQDAMHTDEWSVYHSRLSFAMNVKMLHPLDVVKRCIEEYRKRDDIELNQIEGFVRQIIGWREFMRGVYWAHMPEYAKENALRAERPLPSYFWTGDTRMNCVKHAVKQSLEHAYAHHIQRLMVTGNFALLAGVNPDELDQWYLGIYIDAFEWVEITNTRGMSQYADSGIVGTKPYNSSANYIHKMSNYCSGCAYDHKAKVGKDACPFNSLYWHFYDRHRDDFGNNPRIGMAYRNLDRMDPEKRAALLERGQWCLDNLESL